MKVSQLISICLFLIAFQTAVGQDIPPVPEAPQKKYIKYLDFRIENGAMLGNGSDIGDQLIEASYYNGIDLRLAFRKSDPNDVYSNVYRRPYLGVGWYSSTFNNADIGNPHALYFFMTMPFTFETNKKLSFAYTGAFGLSYKFNPYDEVNNPANIFIGSYRNCYLHMGFLANYKFNEKLALNGTLGFKHFSNGSFKQPNYGINLIPVTLGLSYKFSDDEIYHYKTSVPDYIKHDLINVTFSAGSKNYEAGEENYLKTVIGVNYLRQIGYRYRAGLGVDLFYSAASDLRNTSDASDFSKYYSAGIIGTWEWAITERLYIPVGLGVYLHRNEENGEISPLYQRAGIRYRFNNNIVAGVTIKAHNFGVADIFEWTVGYTFHKDPNKY